MSTPTKLSSSGKTPAKSSSGGRFQRVFTESDETQLLKIFLRISKDSNPSSNPITSPNLAHIEASLGLRFSHSQIIDKLRRLRIKYHRQARSKSLIKTPHDLRLHKIARNIWGKKTPPAASIKRQRHERTERTRRHQQHEKEVEEKPETRVGSEDSPAPKVEFSGAFPENDVWEKGLMGLEEGKLRGLNERWILLRMEEAELMARKAELVKEQMELMLEVFRIGSSSST